MGLTKVLGIALILAGIFGLLYGSFSYTKDTHSTKVGPIELSVQEKQTVNLPVALSAGALASGVVLLIVGFRRK